MSAADEICLETRDPLCDAVWQAVALDPHYAVTQAVFFPVSRGGAIDDAVRAAVRAEAGR